MGKENDLFNSKLKSYLCTECGKIIEEGQTYYYPFEDFEQNIAQFPDEYIICEKCKKKHEVI